MEEVAVILDTAFEFNSKKNLFVLLKEINCFILINDVNKVHSWYYNMIYYACNFIKTNNDKFTALKEAMIALCINKTLFILKE